MKTTFMALLVCLFSYSSASATTLGFNFQIWKNGVNQGYFSGTATNAIQYVVTSQSLGPICPGDELMVKNLCSKNGSPHSFNGSSEKGQISLSNSAGYLVPLDIIGDICPGGSGCTTSSLHFPNWNYGATITFTVPASGAQNYLVFNTGIAGNQSTGNNCGQRFAYIPIDLAPTTSISDMSICPGDNVTVPTTSGFTYSNWSPSNPNVTAPTSTTTYTVDITHTGSACTISETFTIRVQYPDANLSLANLCYNESSIITEDDFFNLYVGQTSPISIAVNGVIIGDINNNIYNFPHVIDAPTYGVGTVTIDYTYMKGGITCTQTYEVVIHPQIVLNMQSSYGFCNSNFQPICATSSGLAQPGISYVWTQSGVPFVVGIGVCLTPSSYGTYTVRAEDEFGCVEARTFTVVDPGVGIVQPKSIVFCSMKQRPPSYIGWTTDPFGPIFYSFAWTYTSSITGSTVSIANTGAQYQVPYLGPGTYTAVVNANGCTETFDIIVIDQLNVFNNSAVAAFGVVPQFGMANCTPVINPTLYTNVWTVVDEFGMTISHTVNASGTMSFAYTTGVEYSITLTRKDVKNCSIYANEISWEDNVRKASRRMNTNSDLNANTVKTISTFPNPTTGLVNIKLEEMEGASQIRVMNALGQVVLEKTSDANLVEIDLSQQVSGMYMIHILNGETEQIAKVVKQ